MRSLKFCYQAPFLRWFSRSTCGFLIGGICLFGGLNAKADERQDLHAWSDFLKKQEALKLEPDAALVSYDGFLQSHPNLVPGVAIIVVTYKANTLAYGLKNPDAAIALLDQARDFYSQPDHLGDSGNLLRLVRFKSEVLVSQKKWSEVEPLLRSNWARIIEVGQQAKSERMMDVTLMVHHYVWALAGVGKTTEIIPVLTQALSEMPGLLSGKGQLRDGSLYEDLVTRLLEAGRKDEALEWAKLQFMLCPFEAEDLGRSTKLLVRVWAEQGQNGLVAMAAFSKAQSDSTVHNPLADVKLPPLTDTTMAAQYDRLQSVKGRNVLPSFVSDLVTLDLVAGQYGMAMQRAGRFLQENPTSPVGGQEVTRVFKAASLNAVDANQFLLFIKNQGDNPVPAFFEKYGRPDKLVEAGAQ